MWLLSTAGKILPDQTLQKKPFPKRLHLGLKWECDWCKVRCWIPERHQNTCKCLHLFSSSHFMSSVFWQAVFLTFRFAPSPPSHCEVHKVIALLLCMHSHSLFFELLWWSHSCWSVRQLSEHCLAKTTLVNTVICCGNSHPNFCLSISSSPVLSLSLECVCVPFVLSPFKRLLQQNGLFIEPIKSGGDSVGLSGEHF